MQPKASEVARGRWRDILPALGVPSEFLSGKHQACPMCGGKDRARFDDLEGNGSYICGQCGAGDGLALLMKINGWDFAEAAKRVTAIAGDYTPRQAKHGGMTDGQRRTMLRDAWTASGRVVKGDVVSRYLKKRGLDLDTFPHALRTAPDMDCDGASYPAMLATVSDAMGIAVSMHRTFLRGDGAAKADVPSPRKLMPGTLPKGAAIRLGEVEKRMGIAEGIETALAATLMFGLPVWSAINSTLLSQWIPPKDAVRKITIYGDNDPKYGGQAAAYQLAHRLAIEDFEVSVEIPPEVGQDWNDVLLANGRGAAGHEVLL